MEKRVSALRYIRSIPQPEAYELTDALWARESPANICVKRVAIDESHNVLDVATEYDIQFHVLVKIYKQALEKLFYCIE